MECRWRARALWVCAGAIVKHLFGSCARSSSPRLAPRRCRNRRRTTRQMCRGLSKYIRLYLCSCKLPSRRFTFDELESLAVGFRRALQHWRMFIPLATTAQILGVGPRRPCRVKACGGMLWAMARIAPARGDDAHCPSTARQTTFHDHTHTHVYISL
jgi:hypothetical protein